jgi:hypothetical protein
MKVYLTLEASAEVSEKLNLIADKKIEEYFEKRAYSNELDYLYIGVFCMSPTFESFFAPRKLKYTSETKQYIHKGIPVVKHAKTFEYELRLEFDIYNKLDDIRPQLAIDIINSLDNIPLCKKIKNLDLDRFKEDFRQLFKELEWTV